MSGDNGYGAMDIICIDHVDITLCLNLIRLIVYGT